MNTLEINTNTPSKASRAPMLIEIPMNRTSPTSASKAAKRLSSYPSPRKEHTIKDINERLQGADQRREKMITAKIDNKQKMERVQKNQEDIKTSKKEAAAAKACKLAKAEANRENLVVERVKKAAEHVTHAKEVCSSIKKAEQAEYKIKLEAIEASQQKAAEKRGTLIEEKKMAAASHVESVHDKIAQKGKEEREKKAALDQKLKDAEARRKVVEVNKTMQNSRKASAIVTERAKVVIEVDTSGDLTAKCNPSVKNRLEAQSNSEKKSSLSLENVEEKLKGAEERREQYMQQRLSSPKHKKNVGKFQQNREKIENTKKEADEAKAKRAAEAELKAKLLNEEKAKKAGEHCIKVKQVMASHQESEAVQMKSKKESIETKQQAAEARHQAQLQQKKEGASTFNLKVGENAKSENAKLKTKRIELDQKMKDVEARRRVQETYKASPAKLRVGGATSPKRAAKPPAPPTFE